MSIYDKTGHIDQITEWWENAAQIAPMRGDLVIEDVTDEDGPDYRIRKWPGDRREKLSYVRVLEPKTEPVWHDAVAVRASSTNQYFEIRTVWTRDGEGWINTAGEFSDDDDLIDPVPLIEAKVTDEMVERARDYMSDQTGQTHTRSAIRGVLSAALGIEDSNV